MFLTVLSFLLSITFWLWIILKYDRFEREPLKSVLFVLIAGGLMSTVPAALLNSAFSALIDQWSVAVPGLSVDAAKLLLYHAFVGINEETLKAVAAVLLIRRMKGFNEPADALVYAMTVALGFAVVENISYTLRFGLASFFIRQFNAVPLHIGLAAIWGTGIAKAKFLRGNYSLTLAPYLLMAALIHSTYNVTASFNIHPAITLLVITVIPLSLIRFATRRMERYAQDGPFANRIFCHACGTVNFPDQKVCKKCGRKFELEFYSLCPGCNARVSKISPDCPNCGAAFERSPE